MDAGTRAMKRAFAGSLTIFQQPDITLIKSVSLKANLQRCNIQPVAELAYIGYSLSKERTKI